MHSFTWRSFPWRVLSLVVSSALAVACSAAGNNDSEPLVSAAGAASVGVAGAVSAGAPAGGALGVAGASAGATFDAAGAPSMAGAASGMAGAEVGGGAAGGAAGDGNLPSTPRQKLLAFISGISGKQTLAGEHNRESSQGDFIAAMKNVTGHSPALWGGDFLFETNEIQNRSNVVNHLMAGWKAGSVISLMYHACSPAMGEACSFDNGIKASLSDAQWADLTTDGGKLNGVWKSRLDAISPYFQKLKDAGIAPIFRIHHEMNQGVFWWGGRKGPGGTAKLYQITHDYLVKTKGFDNIVWVWSVQDIFDDSTNSWNFDAYNPGSDYWDIMALDFYDGKGYTTDKYQSMLKVAGDKPIAIGECQTLPTAQNLLAQPRWVYFLGWAELVQQDNSNSTITSLYTSQNVLTQDEMPGW